ncbi:hypothetical protein IMG5_005530 [Ichthyophthirius multifiliis]|uniref:Uncharacterized protein n=1 Tax=Ichthyophthirius multifiliis TaxID=5932 RepID=G0QJI0_ICHMU|nr:hypothetical protein IMG5_005530 [Ichthyophthirius multifiliis]EGR34631.1 hypothetical protein IMG5_005530 [Ichthyophthirius multifiliis]|eukprot:XP_004039935.1 hypothetical protein IMG5_005530 [Ichthyophthirius multifiliis]
MSKIVPIEVKCLDVGKRVKMSKKKYVWTFSIDDQNHILEVFVSFASGKRKILHNKKLIYDKKHNLNGNDRRSENKSNLDIKDVKNPYAQTQDNNQQYQVDFFDEF